MDVIGCAPNSDRDDIRQRIEGLIPEKKGQGLANPCAGGCRWKWCCKFERSTLLLYLGKEVKRGNLDKETKRSGVRAR